MFNVRIAVQCAWAAAVGVTTLVAGAGLIVLADIGGPGWVFVLLGLWLWTIGMPTTLGVLLAASLWGTVHGLTTDSLTPFALFAAALGLSAQVAVSLLLNRARGSRTTRRVSR